MIFSTAKILIKDGVVRKIRFLGCVSVDIWEKQVGLPDFLPDFLRKTLAVCRIFPNFAA